MKQRGAAMLMLMTALLIAGLGFMLVKAVEPQARQRAQDDATDRALTQAKAALIGYAVTTAMERSGPGNLLCPTLYKTGTQEGGSCEGEKWQSRRLGFLPWKTLGEAEIPDSQGEHLWYAISNNFRDMSTPANSNSDTSGTITVRDASGRIVFDGSTGNGVAAVIIAPGPPLTSPRLQKRPSNNPADYLDIALGEDNASFRDGTTDGFINGPVRSSDGQLISNDRLVVITRDELLAATERRIAGEVRNCLMAWAEINSDQFPSPAPVDSIDYRSTEGTLFGRVPQKFNRNPSASIAAAVAKLQAARSQLIASTSQTQPGAMLAINRANTSLINALSGTTITASSMTTLSGAPLLAQIETSALDPLVTTNGQTSPASALVSNPSLSQTISNAFYNLASATSATTTAARRLQQTSAKTVKYLDGLISDVLGPASTIRLADRSALGKMVWGNTALNCTWLDPDKKDSNGRSDPSGWVSNQWIKHLYYQIDQRNLVRNSDGTPAVGALSINGRNGYQLVVIAAGRALATQNRSSVFDPAQFFEGLNAHASRTGGAVNPSKTFEQRPLSDTFNDQLAY